MILKEDFLHFVWQHKLLVPQLYTSDTHEPIQILRTGMPHTESGPDFTNARIKIGDTMWVGNVELHVKSSDWLKHKHEEDPAYRNVILHVVWEHDLNICYSNGTKIPTLMLKNVIPEILLEKYQNLFKNKNTIPCQNQIQLIDKTTSSIWLSRLMAERLEYRWKEHSKLLKENKGDWDNLLWRNIAHTFGRGINAQPFEWLLQRYSVSIQKSCSAGENTIEIFLLAISGLMPIYADKIPAHWFTEAEYLMMKHQVQPLTKEVWKLKGFMPAGNPYKRILQFANLLRLRPLLFSLIIETESIKNLQLKIQKIYLTSDNSPGLEMMDSLFLNAIIPTLYSYGKFIDDENLCNKALEWLQDIKPENNHITKFWSKFGIKLKTAEETQALKHLMDYYCNAKKCMKCHFAYKILNTKDL